MLAAHRIPGRVELIQKYRGTRERVLQVPFINASHQFHITRIDRMELIGVPSTDRANISSVSACIWCMIQ